MIGSCSISARFVDFYRRRTLTLTFDNTCEMYHAFVCVVFLQRDVSTKVCVLKLIWACDI